jgi:hypothetical protein
MLRTVSEPNLERDNAPNRAVEAKANQESIAVHMGKHAPLAT